MNLTLMQKSAIVGMILGDGFLQKTGSQNARLRLEHRADHKDYLVWKTKLLPNLFHGRPKFMERIHPITKRAYRNVRHQSNSSPILGKFQRLFYQNGKKNIPANLEKLLASDIGLAIWYFDDGYYYPRDKCAYIYLGRVSETEAEIASKVIKRRFGLENRILDKKNKGFVIYFSPDTVFNLKKTVKRYLVPVMAYKLPS